MANRILIVEDEPDLAQVLEYNLSKAGFETVATPHGRRGLELVRKGSADLVLLDVMLPDISGTEVCREIKHDPSTAHIPVILLTARGEEIDRVVGFELGADDYVVKPFSVRELILRVHAILRRDKAGAATEDVVEFGALRIDTSAHRVWVDGQEVELTALEFKLLVLLWQRKNRVQSRSSLLADVWDIAADINTRTVDTHVKRLREKLAGAADYIETVRGVGYRFADQPQA
jgi:two-component system phosphate regulon response regulator PhoB